MLMINKLSRVPIYEQIIEQIENLIASGVFTQELPSVRMLSQQLSINPNTLQKAYTELERRGICYSVPGSGRFVAGDAKAILREEKRAGLKEIAKQVKTLALNEISEEEIIACVQQAYREAFQKNDRGEIKI
ncbi:MAG: GntR family transcriptional regulator [Christensenellales bacterium]